MPAYVIDSNMMQADELRNYLEEGSDFLAVLPDFAWYELYKPQSLEGLRLGLSVIGDFPNQVVLLHSSGYISRLDPAVADQPDRLVIDGPHGDIAEMVQIVRSEGPMAPSAVTQLMALWEWARDLSPSLIEGAKDFAESFPEMQASMFDRREVRIIRTNARYTLEMYENIYGAAFHIWETIATEYGIAWQALEELVVAKTYLFRFALGLVINLLWWIRSGSQPVVRLDRMSNDVIDISFAVYATYFDGLMTRDAKAKWVHCNLAAALTRFNIVFGQG